MMNYLTTAEVAQRLGVSVHTIARWAKSNKLPLALRVPGYRGSLLFDPKDVDAFASSEAPEPSPAEQQLIDAFDIFEEDRHEKTA